MVPVVPLFNQPPPRGLFVVLEFLPIAFSFFVWISILVTTVIIRCAYHCYRRQIFIVKENCLFTEKKLQLGEKEWKKVLFLDKRPEYQGSKNPKTGLMVLFASLGIMIICISALGFFRHFPVTTGSECLERDNNFNTWYCYDNSSSDPLDCEEYVNRNESSNSSILKCYVFSLDIGTSSGIAFGLYELCSLVVFGIVFITKCFYWMFQKCEMPVAWGVYCYSVTLSFILLIIALCLFVYVFFVDIAFLITEEHIYRCALPLILTVFAVYALIIPLLMHRYDVDTWPTYNCLATKDKEAESIFANNPAIACCNQLSAHPQEVDCDNNGDQQYVDGD